MSNEASVEESTATASAGQLTKITVNGGAVETALDLGGQYKTWTEFAIGDTVRIHYKIKEGDKHRVQVYEGTVIAMRGEGLNKTFNVRRVSHEIGVERIFPYHSPMIQKIETSRRGRVRRARLFYLRHKSGKEGRIKEAYSNMDAPGAEGRAEKAAVKKKKASKATAKAAPKKAAASKES